MTGTAWLRGVSSLLLGALLVSCASIPLSTALRLSRLDRQAFTNLDPRSIRVRVAVQEGVELNPDSIELGVMLSGAGAHSREVFALAEQLRTPGTRSAGLFRGSEAVVQHELALTPDSAQRFAELQHRAFSDQGGRYELDVNASLSRLPPTTRVLRLWIDVRLDQDGPYMVLFDGAELPVEYDR
ncbi:hypothetical protein FKV24_014905 [Lysobacter maris]|uniref:Uncharacterized protein n=1 Tax=Marilutibacter maris TaxID=1605891 RepID=A0A508AHW9_9GAMM|nr:hypothetical protein [Lysobacter maris]KAB8172355.1 hypothetical protein FKV24_014905 [Lysobacter maris]